MMTRIVFLTPDDAPNSIALHLPLRIYRHALYEAGMDIQILTHPERGIPECDLLFVDCKFYRSLWDRTREKALQSLESWRKRTNALLWLDTTDSSGTAYFEVLPYVDSYYKGQLLRDRSLYLRPLYGMRLFTDFYHTTFGIIDSDPLLSDPLPRPEDLPKLHLFWNSALGNWGPFAPLANRLRRLFPSLGRRIQRFTPPSSPRPIPITCRLSREYARETIAFQRATTIDRLERIFGVTTTKIPRRAYWKELTRARIGVSPFGWGEIAYRDFELILAGAALFKPSMESIETWPDLYRDGETYLSYRWDVSDFESRLGELLEGDRARRLAENAQALYASVLEGSTAKEAFLQRMQAIVDRHTKSLFRS